jgi:hypothetical protein
VIPEASQGVQAWDRYAYTNNNPVCWNDPTGHCPFCIIAALIIGAILLAGDTPQNTTPPVTADGNASNLGDLLTLGLEHADDANIIGEGLQSLQDDPSVQAAQDRIVDDITNNPMYGKESYSAPDTSDTFTANGPSGDWRQAALENNQAFFMVHTGSLSATKTSVGADGTLTTRWVVSDTFDYTPDFNGHGFAYNFFAVPIHLIYNTLLGAEERLPTNAYWDETIPPDE